MNANITLLQDNIPGMRTQVGLSEMLVISTIGQKHAPGSTNVYGKTRDCIYVQIHREMFLSEQQNLFFELCFDYTSFGTA